MIIDFPEAVASKVRAVASARGISPTEVLSELITLLPDPSEEPTVEVDWLEAFIGCGASGDRGERTIGQLRNALSAAQLAHRS